MTAFEQRCQDCEDSTGVRFSYMFTARDGKTNVSEDDGSLQISWRGQRGCFDINADATLRQQNESIAKVLAFFGMMKWYEKVKWSDEDVERQEDRDEECPHCGHSH